MQPPRPPISRCRQLLTACVLGSLLAGCAVVGPASISNGRIAYTEAITETNNQQMLMTVIKNRYEERGNMLAVASVTANVRVVTSSGIQLGLGDSDNYAGNLVPFSAGAVYEENPTISYTPVAGEKYTRQLFSPLPVSVLAQMAGTLTDPAPYYTALVSSVNGIHNPNFLFASAEPDPRFSRIIALMTELAQTQHLHWVKDQRQDDRFSVVIDRSDPGTAAGSSELLGLLGVSVPKDPSARVVLPVSLALDGRDSGGIGMLTNSVWDLVEILSAAIEVPEGDQQNGITTGYPPPGLVGRNLRVRHAVARPEHAYLVVKHHDVWFYIDERDLATKQFFRLLGTLWSVTIAENSSGAAAAPVLTVPVSH